MTTRHALAPRACLAGIVIGVLSGALTVAACAVPLTAGAASVQVQPGQNLTGLAAEYGTTVAALAAANGITNPNQIIAGTTLVVPGTSPATTAATTAVARTITVMTGDTLSAIAARYGVSVANLAAANGITNPNYVAAGRTLTIPTATAAQPVAGASDSSLPPQLLAQPDRLALQPLFVHWAAVFGIPAPLLEAMCWWESGWQSQVVSPTGAVGIGQLEPATSAQMQTQLGQPGLNPALPSDNIEMAAAFLADLLRATGSSQLALASYYQGMASLGLIGELPSTVQYVNGIMAYVPYFSG